MDLAKVVGPKAKREPPEELRFFADSKEQLEASVNGMRDKIDQTFKKAIDRAKADKRD